MRDPAKEREEAAERLKREREAEWQRMAECAEVVLKTKEGKALFGYLCKRFHLHGKSFVAADVRSSACPYAAASRDGEKSVLWHLIDLARASDPDFPIP